MDFQKKLVDAICIRFGFTRGLEGESQYFSCLKLKCTNVNKECSRTGQLFYCLLNKNVKCETKFPINNVTIIKKSKLMQYICLG